MRRAAIGSLAALALGALLAGGLALALRPPRLPVPERHDRVFRDVTLAEAGRPLRPGRTLRIADGRIAAIEAPALAAAVAAGPRDSARAPLEAPDLAGLVVAPGWIDMHVHYPPAVAVGNAELWSLLFLAHGVTTVRETGSIDGGIFGVREAIRAGHSVGPRIFACGAMLDGDPPSFPSNRVVRTPEEARRAVEEQVARGADCIKAYNMLTPEALAAIRETAARLGVPVLGHAPHSVSLEEAGLVDLQHGTGAVVIDRARVGRYDFRTEDWATVDAARIAHVAAVSRAQGIAHTPTLANSRLRRLLVPGAPVAEAVAADSGLRHLPDFWPVAWSLLWSPPFAPDDREARALHDRFRARQAALAAGLHAAGVEVHAGTDTLMPFVAPGSSLHRELVELAEAGIPRDDVWRIATRDAGRFLGEPGLGTLAPGAPADLVFLREPPRGDGSDPARIEAVLADGRLYRRAELEDALARFDAHFHGRLYSTVMGAVIRVVQGRFAPERAAAISDAH